MFLLLYRILVFYALYVVIKRLLKVFIVYRHAKKVKREHPQDFTKNSYSNKNDIVDVEYHEVKNN